jgi:hypothetical protein
MKNVVEEKRGIPGRSSRQLRRRETPAARLLLAEEFAN